MLNATMVDYCKYVELDWTNSTYFIMVKHNIMLSHWWYCIYFKIWTVRQNNIKALNNYNLTWHNPTFWHQLGRDSSSSVLRGAGERPPRVPVLSPDADLADSGILVIVLRGRVLDGVRQCVSVKLPFKCEWSRCEARGHAAQSDLLPRPWATLEQWKNTGGSHL